MKGQYFFLQVEARKGKVDGIQIYHCKSRYPTRFNEETSDSTLRRGHLRSGSQLECEFTQRWNGVSPKSKASMVTASAIVTSAKRTARHDRWYFIDVP